MNQLELASALSAAVAQHKKLGRRIGFVPTMGALHQGHISLIKKAKLTTDVVVVSIFVNPTQFNESSDYKHYPRTLTQDLVLLKQAGVDIIFTPTVDEVYPVEYQTGTYNFGLMERVMEGEQRPGHFNGVAMVVKRLFDIVQPDAAFFGEKDFQQLAIIKQLVVDTQLNIEVVGCSTARESNGLAMSSRNKRLTSEQREKASIIFNTLSWAKAHVNECSPIELQAKALDMLKQESMLEVEYVTISRIDTFQNVTAWDDAKSVGMFVAARFGEVRLIDNMMLI